MEGDALFKGAVFVGEPSEVGAKSSDEGEAESVVAPAVLGVKFNRIGNMCCAKGERSMLIFIPSSTKREFADQLYS